MSGHGWIIDTLYLVVLVFGIIGYVRNIFLVLDIWGGDLTTELIVRLVGCAVPILGAILGYF